MQVNPHIANGMASIKKAMNKAKGDPQRPVCHFRPPAQWMNDINGCIFHKGYYHLFYQHNPYDDVWGHMHWGHARSKDLISWEHLPLALWPSLEQGEEHCYSGSVIINGQNQPLAFYTCIGPERRRADSAEQWLALGDKDLITWEKYEQNPILAKSLHGTLKVNHWRDPFLFHEKDRTFMIVGGKLPSSEGGEAALLLYEARKNSLKSWEYKGIFFRHPDKLLGSLECPNFFKLNGQWILIVSTYNKAEYFLGNWVADEVEFIPIFHDLIDHSPNFYATHGLIDDQGRIIIMGWLRGFMASRNQSGLVIQPKAAGDWSLMKGRGWNGCMSLPRMLSLDSHSSLKLIQKPVAELQKLRQMHHHLTTGNAIKCQAETLEIKAKLKGLDKGEVVIKLGQGDNTIDAIFSKNEIEIDGRTWSRNSAGDLINLHLFIDRSVIEIFLDNHQCITVVVHNDPNRQSVELLNVGQNTHASTFDVWELSPVWVD